ncbi:hypothetical phage protein [Psychrobacter phage Psymv2]|uniref:hypothetical protein n=1 Tax=Psychrobacter phage Psymv2 TaxID=1071177 RepID=UPI00022A37FF|nr:hypothetical protein CJ96_gp37 [Psychrobacter phage Psymv2]AEO01013.1 hypothetical phage protein [Psychrobacter phage Psymv2]
MKKFLKWFAIFMGAMILLGFIALIFESDEDKAARELKIEQDKIAAAQVDADKLQEKAEKKAAKDKADAERKVVKTLSGIPNLGDKSEAELLTNCQIDIQNKLNNPRSMDIIHSNLKYKKEPNHELWFQFYAKNQFNAESKHTGMCEFDDSGKLLSSKFE